MPERRFFPRSALCINGKNNTPKSSHITVVLQGRGGPKTILEQWVFPCVQPSKYNCSLACFGNTRNGRIILEQEISLNGRIILKQGEYILYLDHPCTLVCIAPICHNCHIHVYTAAMKKCYFFLIL